MIRWTIFSSVLSSLLLFASESPSNSTSTHIDLDVYFQAVFFAYGRKASLDSIFQIPFPSEPFNLKLISSFLNTCLETCFSINQVEAEIWCVLFSEEKGCTNSTEKREGRFLCCDTEIKFMLLVAEALQKRETWKSKEKRREERKPGSRKVNKNRKIKVNRDKKETKQKGEEN